MTAALFVKLKEVADFNPTIEQRLPPGEEVDFIPMARVDETLVRRDRIRHASTDDVSAGDTYFQNRDILVAKITPCIREWQHRNCKPKSLTRLRFDRIPCFRASARKLEPRYLVDFLRQTRLRKEGEMKMTGSAGNAASRRHFLETLDIRLPSLKEQRRIAAILDAADALRQKRRQALHLLDQLAQSMFTDLFGDLSLNDRGWRMAEVQTSSPASK